MDETAVLRDLDNRLRGVRQPDGSRMAERERRIRLAHLESAEELVQRVLERGLSVDELEEPFGASGLRGPTLRRRGFVL